MYERTGFLPQLVFSEWIRISALRKTHCSSSSVLHKALLPAEKNAFPDFAITFVLLETRCACKILAMVKTIVCWIGTVVSVILSCARKTVWDEEGLYSSLSLFACCHRAPSQPCSQLFLWWNRSPSHCQVGNLLTAGSFPRRGGSSSNTSAVLASFTRPAEWIALITLVFAINSLGLNEGCWYRGEEAALRVITAQIACILSVKHNFHHQWSYDGFSLKCTHKGHLLLKRCHTCFQHQFWVVVLSPSLNSWSAQHRTVYSILEKQHNPVSSSDL